MKKRLITIIITALAAGTFAGTLTIYAEENEQYQVAISAEDTGVSVYKTIAEANGLEDNLNLKIDWVEGLSSGPEIIAAITGGSVDIGKIGDFPVVTNYGGGETPSFKVVGYTENVTDSAMFVKEDSDIESLEDLKGKVIGTQIGTGSQYQTQVSLAKAGLTIDDVTLVNVDNGSWSSAFAAGEIDAACVLKQFVVGNEEIGEIRILDEADYALNSWIANTEWVEENPETAARVLILCDRVLDFVEKNKEEAISQIMKAYPDGNEERIVYTLESLKNTFLSPFSDQALNRYQELKDFALDVGTISSDFEVEEVYDNSYIELANEIAADFEK